MSRIFFASELDTAASFWRIYRTDGVTLGFTTHDRDLGFDGIVHRAAPGMLPSAIRQTIDLSDDSAEIEGALSHGSISGEDIAAGRFDRARIEVGIVDWQTLERAALYGGLIGAVTREGQKFTAQLHSAKADLDIDTVPRSSPGCRARFCGPGCNLSPVTHTVRMAATAIDHAANSARFALAVPNDYLHGELRWIDGPQTGVIMQIIAASEQGLVLDQRIGEGVLPGHRAMLREGCDHTIATCAARFGNAVNFRGEPFIPGNDLLTRYPVRR